MCHEGHDPDHRRRRRGGDDGDRSRAGTVIRPIDVITVTTRAHTVYGPRPPCADAGRSFGARWESGKIPTVDQPDFLIRTRDGYDRTAADYAERFHHHLDDKPVELAVLSAFAGLINKGPNRQVVDVGCGTGATTDLLHSHGVDPVGIDLSPGMIAEARRLNPALAFRVGSMTSLDTADDSVGGVCAWYSIIHIPDSHLGDVFSEFRRVLTPGGLVLLAFQVGDEPLVLTEAFGHDVHLTYARRRPQDIRKMLADNGFDVYAEVVRQPDDNDVESTPQAFVIARKRPPHSPRETSS